MTLAAPEGEQVLCQEEVPPVKFPRQTLCCLDVWSAWREWTAHTINCQPDFHLYPLTPMSKVEVFLGQKGVCTAGFGAERGGWRASDTGRATDLETSSRETEGGLHGAPGAVQCVMVSPCSQSRCLLSSILERGVLRAGWRS